VETKCPACPGIFVGGVNLQAAALVSAAERNIARVATRLWRKSNIAPYRFDTMPLRRIVGREIQARSLTAQNQRRAINVAQC
jgi:hypothetical protein